MIKRILFWISIIILDVFLYIAIGLILLNYEDFYDESKGAYWSFESMTLLESTAYISYYVLITANILLVLYLIYKFLIKRFLLS